MSQLLPVVGPNSPVASSITIQKVRLKDQHLTCEFTEQRTEDAPPRAFALPCAEQVHPDLPHTFRRLVPRLCLLNEQLTEGPGYWPADDEERPACFEAFAVTGFSVGRNQGGVTLIGQRQLTGARVPNPTTPYQSFDNKPPACTYAGRLETALCAALAEVEAALRGKCTEYRQLDLFEQPATPLLTATT